MRLSTYTVRIRTICSILLPLGILFGSTAMAQDKHIDVSVEGGKLVFLNSACPDLPNDKGCVLAEQGSSPMISWELTGAGSAEWSFKELRFDPTPLQECTVADFGLSGADKMSGLASTAQVVAGGRRLQIRDHNRNVCITRYKLSAESVDGRRIDSDPVIDNRGGFPN